MMRQDTWLIVGLGNPGKRYDRTWHNAGRMAVEALALRHGISIKRRRFRALTGDGVIHGKKIRLLLPNTYMNLSGESVIRAMTFEKIAPERIIVVYDDFDLSLGRIRIRTQGSAGSHNGMKSLLQHIKSDRFPRIRIGIGPPVGDVIQFVLSKIPESKEEALTWAIDDACEAIELLIDDRLQEAQERYNKKDL
ncbi:MAG: aminoacyl-tRNA hydrolase [Clostridiales bacterium]|jgi:PTH1 family peptidyl-tRNA hydrolase|nr:aminoacyl-tRNA hydrolase [Clostridiales bacterium]MDD3418243.1 aminoacyl-tRNA hydrolase [Eubacteriales bacterium]MDY0119066.1 aminoacyl-tRNA hydrolase [Clostridia bacterium]NLG30112.1 aminoacyl-tRNA hydrolase [Clostridiaceae bacterium]MDD3539733.1 aminoacyl-tRNA hydrolase [Eubacteriales bacterium]